MAIPEQAVLIERNIKIDERKGLDSSLIAHYRRALFLPDGSPTGGSFAKAFTLAEQSWKAAAKLPPHCRGTNVPEQRALRWAQIQKARSFVYFHTDEPWKSSATERFLDRMNRPDSDARDYLTGQLCSGETLPFAWATSADDLRAEFKDTRLDRCADIACQVLGIEWEDGEDVVLISFPPEYFQSVSIPTFVDARDHILFCAWLDESASVGYSWRLDRQDRGLPEIVFEQIELDRRAEIHHLGQTTSSRRGYDFLLLWNRVS